MRLIKMIHKSIYSISFDEYVALKNKPYYQISERDLYIVENGTSYIAVDNSRGDFKEENFEGFRQAIEYLLKIDEIKPLKR